MENFRNKVLEFVKENEDRFLSQDIPEEIKTRFYEGKLTFSDLKSNQEVREKYTAIRRSMERW